MGQLVAHEVLLRLPLLLIRKEISTLVLLYASLVVWLRVNLLEIAKSWLLLDIKIGNDIESLCLDELLL